MQYVKFSNGLMMEWDETITVGSLITTYNEGYHILMGIDYEGPERSVAGYYNRDPHPIEWSNKDLYPMYPIFKYQKVMKADGSPSKRLNGRCAASYCAAVTRDTARENHAQEVAEADRKFTALMQYL